MQHKELSLIIPVAIGIVVLAAGLLQLTNWKLHQLACCRELPFRGQTAPDDARSAWKHGLQLGIQCSRCSAGLMSILLVMGMMNLFGMAIVTVAINFERLAPASKSPGFSRCNIGLPDQKSAYYFHLQKKIIHAGGHHINGLCRFII